MTTELEPQTINVLMLVVAIVAIFVGILNGYFLLIITRIWNKLDRLDSKLSSDVDGIYKVIRANEKATADEIKEMRKQYADINTKLEVLISSG